jgi:hypothetical protein
MIETAKLSVQQSLKQIKRVIGRYHVVSIRADCTVEAWTFDINHCDDSDIRLHFRKEIREWAMHPQPVVLTRGKYIKTDIANLY